MHWRYKPDVNVEVLSFNFCFTFTTKCHVTELLLVVKCPVTGTESNTPADLHLETGSPKLAIVKFLGVPFFYRENTIYSD